MSQFHTIQKHRKLSPAKRHTYILWRIFLPCKRCRRQVLVGFAVISAVGIDAGAVVFCPVFSFWSTIPMSSSSFSFFLEIDSLHREEKVSILYCRTQLGIIYEWLYANEEGENFSKARTFLLFRQLLQKKRENYHLCYFLHLIKVSEKYWISQPVSGIAREGTEEYPSPRLF